MAGNHNRRGNLEAAPVCLDKHDSAGAGTAAPGPHGFSLIGGGVLVVALVVGAIAAVGYVCNVAQSAPALGSLQPIVGGGSSQVFAADGTRLGFIQSDELRTPVGWSEIPANLKNATVAIEDQRFYKNNGVDLTGIFRAAVKDVTHGEALQGGSTITMQLMRNLYLGGDQHTLQAEDHRGEAAIEYNKHHSKRSILTSYLNSVPYGTVGGQTAIGVQAAARDVLRQAGLAARPGAVGAARRPAAGALAVQPVPRLRQARARTAQRGAGEDGRTALHHAPPQARRRGAPLEVHRGDFYSDSAKRTSSSNTSASSCSNATAPRPSSRAA